MSRLFSAPTATLSDSGTPPVTLPDLRQVPGAENASPITSGSGAQSSAREERAFRPVPPSGASPTPPAGLRWPITRDWVDFELNSEGYAVAYGDVLLGKPIHEDGPKRGRGEAQAPQLWQSPVIPFAIDPALPRPERVRAAIEVFERSTSIRFKPYDGERDAIQFERGEQHCYSFLGRVGGVQPIKLSDKCGSSEIVHEIMHALGFVHEHSRTDRDAHVEVLWENIDPQFEAQFAMAPERWMSAYRGLGFDLQSAMLYRPDTFARAEGLSVLKARGQGAIAPVSEGLSAGDIEKIRSVYR